MHLFKLQIVRQHNKIHFLTGKNGKRATTKWRERSEKQKQKKIHTNTKAARESAIHGSNPVIKSVLCVRNTLATTIQKLNIDFVLVLPLLLLLFHSFRCLNTDMLTIAPKHTHNYTHSQISLSLTYLPAYTLCIELVPLELSNGWANECLNHTTDQQYIVCSIFSWRIVACCWTAEKNMFAWTKQKKQQQQQQKLVSSAIVRSSFALNGFHKQFGQFVSHEKRIQTNLWEIFYSFFHFVSRKQSKNTQQLPYRIE